MADGLDRDGGIASEKLDELFVQERRHDAGGVSKGCAPREASGGSARAGSPAVAARGSAMAGDPEARAKSWGGREGKATR